MMEVDDAICPLAKLEDGINFAQPLQNFALQRHRAILRKWASEFSPDPLPLQIDASQIDDIVDRLLPPISKFAPIPGHSVKFYKPDSADNNGEQDITLDMIENSVKFGIWMGMFFPSHRPYDEKTILGVLDNRVFPPLPYAHPELPVSMSLPACGLWLVRSTFEAFVSYSRRMLGIERKPQPTWLARLFLKGLLRHIYDPELSINPYHANAFCRLEALHQFVIDTKAACLQSAKVDARRTFFIPMFALPLVLLSAILPSYPTSASIPFLDNYHGFTLTVPPPIHNSTVLLLPNPATSDTRFGLTLLLVFFIPTQLLLILIIRQLSTIRLSYLAMRDVHQGFFGRGFGDDDASERKGEVGPGMYWFLKWERGRNRVFGAIANAFFHDMLTGVVLVACCVVWNIAKVINDGPDHSGNVGHEETVSGAANDLPLPISLLVLFLLLLAAMLIEVSLRIRFLFAIRAMKGGLFKF